MRFLIVLLITLFVTPQEYRVRLGSVIPKDSPWEEGLDQYLNTVTKRSGNQITFKKYLGGQLGGEVEMVKSIAMGTLHAGAFSTAAISEALNLPELQLFELPFLFNTDEEADYIMDKVMFNTMYDLLLKKGIVLVMWGTNGWRNFGTRTKAIVTPADMRGMKMRSQEADVYVKFYKALGATPVPIATPEVLVSLKTGMVDGFDQTTIFIIATGWVTNAKYYTISRHIYQPGAIVFSKRYFDRFSPELQKAVLSRDVIFDLSAKSRRLVRADDAILTKSIGEDFGLEVITLTEQQRNEFRKACQPVYTQMAQKIPPAMIQKVKTALAEYRKNH